jgi:hypothetical protein
MHTIRLRGPWQLEPVFRYVRRDDGGFDHVTDDLPAAARMHVPADWSAAFGSDFLGRVRYKRTFHTPPGLVPEERVWLVVEPQRSEACIILAKEKQHLVGFVYSGKAAGRFDITQDLDPVSHLEIYIDHPAVDTERSRITEAELLLPGGLIGEIRLEIDE